MTLSGFRESKLFKAIADISLVHRFLTVVPGLGSGVASGPSYREAKGGDVAR